MFGFVLPHYIIIKKRHKYDIKTRGGNIWYGVCLKNGMYLLIYLYLRRRVEPASPAALTTSRTDALQARRSCASSLDTFTQSFLHRAWPKTRSPEIGSRSALIVVAHVFSWPAARLRHVRGGVGRRRSLINSRSGRLAACPNQRSLLCTSGAGMLVRQRRRRRSADGTESLRLTRRMRRMLSLSKTSNILSSAMTIFRSPTFG